MAVPASPVDSSFPEVARLPSERQGPVKALIKSLLQSVRSSSVITLTASESQIRAEKLGVAIEDAVYTSHPTLKGYTAQCRALSHNLKYNQELTDKLLKMELTPHAVSSMTSEELQTKEQQKKDAEMLARATKQATLSDEVSGPRIRRTHKGEEFVGDEDVAMTDVSSTGTAFRKPSESKAIGLLPQDDSQHFHASKNSDFDFKKVLSSVSPTQTSTYRRPSQSVGPVEDADVDRMLGGESPPYSPQAETDPDKIWEGKITMPTQADYLAVAKWAAGCKVNEAMEVPWDQLFPHQMTVAGRIENQIANHYLCSLRYGHCDLSVMTVTPTYPEGKAHQQAIIDYLTSKQRFAVVSTRPVVTNACRVQDLYLAACPAGTSLVEPEFLLNLTDNIIPKNRAEPLLLAIFVIAPSEAALTKAKARQPAASSTTVNGTGPVVQGKDQVVPGKPPCASDHTDPVLLYLLL